MLLVRITPPADSQRRLAQARGRSQLAGVRGRLHSRGRQVRAHPAGDGDRRAGRRPRRARSSTRRASSVPMESPWPARYGVAKSGDPTLIVEAKGLKPDTIRDVYFFPAEWGAGRQHGQADAPAIGADGIRIPLKKGDAKAALPAAARRHAGADGEDRRRRASPGLRRLGQARSGVRAAGVARRRGSGSEQLSLVAGAAVRPAGRPDPEPDALRVPGAGHEGRRLRAAGRP